MFETVLLAMLVAKIKGYKIKPLFKSWAFYPPFILTLFYIFWNITIFCGDYRFIKYAGILEKLYLLSFLALIFNYELYKSAIIGSLSIFIGTALNKLAIAANDGKMPAFPTLSYFTGYIKANSFARANDIHILGDKATKLKFLTDYIDLGYSVLSIGDVFIRFFVFIIVFNTIMQIHKKHEIM